MASGWGLVSRKTNLVIEGLEHWGHNVWGGERSWVSSAVASDSIHPVYVLKLIYHLWTVELSRAF